MPPVNQSSRTALVTWTVVTSFLFVIATIFAIYYYVNGSSLARDNELLRTKYKGIVTEAGLVGDDVRTLEAVRSAPENNYNQSQLLLDVSMKRSERLAKLVAGAAAQSPERAMADGDAAIKAAAAKVKEVGMNLQADNLVTAVNLLRDAVFQRSTEAANARKQAEEAVADAAKRRQDADAQIKALTDQMEKLQADLQEANANVAKMTQEKDQQLQETAAGSDVKLKDVQGSLDKANQQIQELTKQLSTRAQEVDKIEQKLSEIRPDVNRPQLSQADGKIVRLPGDNICFINLGKGDQIIAGMTFEVYDRIEGVPPLGDASNDIALPKGKASIEVTRVGATSSECRIVTTAPGATLSEGDLVANLIYDKNTKNKFLVYGNFDLAHTGRPNAQDTEVIKRLITQWGGEIVSDINVDTDFVVLGVEPTIPVLTADEKNDPVEKAIYDKAVADADAYAAISNKARDYRIPILNQNRFLYMIGYYDLSRR